MARFNAIDMFVLFSIVDSVVVLLPVLLSVAFMTILDRKGMAVAQRRVGPNVVGFYGILQPFADALKLIIKEFIMPRHAYGLLFLLAPMISMFSAMMGWVVVPFGHGLSISEMSLGILFSLAMSSLGVYGILFAGWAANSKYAFLGSLRSASQMISYELLISAAALAVLFCTGSFSYQELLRTQESIYLVVPLMPLAMLYFVAALAETNRTPFDLPEAESELVAGFMTEHSSLPFVLFFLAEYCSIVLMSASCALFFLAGPDFPLFIFSNETPLAIGGLVLGLKTVIFCYLFVHVRSTLPRLRFDVLMTVCWTQFLPVIIAMLVIVPFALASFDYFY